MKSRLVLASLCLGVVSSGNVLAGAVIYNTGDATTATVALGVNDEGHLNTTPNITANAYATGLAYKFGDGTWQDATSPGCLCEGWGVAGNNIAGSANADDGIGNLTLDSFTSTSSTATSVVHLTSLPDLKVTHEYKPSTSGALFEAVVTIENLSTTDVITDIRYRRAMDWDIPTNEFNEYVTIKGTSTTTLLLASSDNGFATSNPLGGGVSDLAGCGITTDFEDCGPADHGALFDFGFGDLGAGESYSFSIFYGAAGNEADALAALSTVGAELYSLGQWSGDPNTGTPATYIFGFKGVGGTPINPNPVPEPSAIALLGLGMMGMVAARRRKQRHA